MRGGEKGEQGFPRAIIVIRICQGSEHVLVGAGSAARVATLAAAETLFAAIEGERIWDSERQMDLQGLFTFRADDRASRSSSVFDVIPPG